MYSELVHTAIFVFQKVEDYTPLEMVDMGS